MECKKVHIHIRGREKTKWEQTRIEHKEGGEMETHHDKYKERNAFYEKKHKLFEFPDGELEPGDYQIPFSFKLKDNLPSSFFIKPKNSPQSVKAKIKYIIKAEMDVDGKDYKYKQILIVREKSGKEKKDFKQSDDAKVAVCFCLDKGACNITCEFDSNTFSPTDDVDCKVIVDNSKCALEVVDV
jgi:hypothetical protein